MVQYINMADHTTESTLDEYFQVENIGWKDQDNNDSLDDEEDTRLYWGEKVPMPPHTFSYQLDDGIYNHYSYVHKFDNDYLVTLPYWLENNPENIYNVDLCRENSLGYLTNITYPTNPQIDYINGDFIPTVKWGPGQLRSIYLSI